MTISLCPWVFKSRCSHMGFYRSRVSISTRLSICLFVCLSVCLPYWLYWLWVYLSVLAGPLFDYPSLYLSFCLTINLPFTVCLSLSVWVSFCPCIGLTICMSLPVWLSVSHSIRVFCLPFTVCRLFIYLSYCLSVYSAIWMSASLYICLTFCLFVNPYVCLSVCLIISLCFRIPLVRMVKSLHSKQDTSTSTAESSIIY